MLLTIDNRREPRIMQEIDPAFMNGAAAVAGAVSGQILSQKQVTVRRMIGLGIAGAFTGIFGGPAICDLAGITKQTLQAGTHFAVGLVGIAICAAIMQFAETANFRGLFARLLGIKEMPPIPPLPKTPSDPPTLRTG